MYRPPVRRTSGLDRRSRRPWRPRPSAGGFTLIEALVAGVILAMTAVLIATALSESIVGLRRAADYQVAAQLLDETLTKIDLIGPDRIRFEGPARGTFDPPHERFAWTTQIDPALDGHLFEIDVLISWSDGRGVHDVAGHTRINCPEESRNELLRWEDL